MRIVVTPEARSRRRLRDPRSTCRRVDLVDPLQLTDDPGQPRIDRDMCVRINKPGRSAGRPCRSSSPHPAPPPRRAPHRRDPVPLNYDRRVVDGRAPRAIDQPRRCDDRRHPALPHAAHAAIPYRTPTSPCASFGGSGASSLLWLSPAPTTGIGHPQRHLQRIDDRHTQRLLRLGGRGRRGCRSRAPAHRRGRARSRRG